MQRRRRCDDTLSGGEGSHTAQGRAHSPLSRSMPNPVRRSSAPIGDLCDGLFATWAALVYLSVIDRLQGVAVLGVCPTSVHTLKGGRADNLDAGDGEIPVHGNEESMPRGIIWQCSRHNGTDSARDHRGTTQPDSPAATAARPGSGARSAPSSATLSLDPTHVPYVS